MDGFGFPAYQQSVQPQEGELLAQGIKTFGSSIAQGIQAYEKAKEEATKRDAYVNFLAQNHPEVFPQEAWERYHAANENQKNKWAIQAGLAYADKQQQQQQEWQNRLNAAHADYYIGQALRERELAAGGGLGGAPRGKIWSDELGGWATPAQADAARRRTPQGYIAQSYGLTPEQIFDSKQHEAGTVSVDTTTGAKTFTNDPKGDQIRIGGASGVIMPKAEHEVYKRQLQMNLGVTGMGGGGAPGAPGGAPGGGPPGAAGAGTVRVRSPQGVVGTIPANRLQEAITAGYTQI
jgi:hypothetical protein